MPFAATIKIGDKVCQFAGSDVAAIFSPSASDINKWAIVGRAYLFKSKLRESSIGHSASLQEWTASIG
jgi:hypothetical protein